MDSERGICVRKLEDGGDERGASFALPEDLFEFLGEVQEVHLAEIASGAVRGNHGHQQKKEVLVIWYMDTCRFGWRKEGELRVLDFSGKGAVLIMIEPMVLHAIKNTGGEMLRILAFSNQKQNRSRPDTFWEEIL